MFRRCCCRRYIENTISESELVNMINNYNVTIIDVRSKQEYDEGHINGAINIPLCEIRKMIGKIAPDRNGIIVVYCTAGIRSAKAINVLRLLGYQNLYNYIYEI